MSINDINITQEKNLFNNLKIKEYSGLKYVKILYYNKINSLYVYKLLVEFVNRPFFIIDTSYGSELPYDPDIVFRFSFLNIETHFVSYTDAKHYLPSTFTAKKFSSFLFDIYNLLEKSNDYHTKFKTRVITQQHYNYHC